MAARRWCGWAAALLTAFLAACRPAVARGEGGGDEVWVECRRTSDRDFRIDGRFWVANATAAWQTLTDYDGLSRFTPDLRTSQVIDRRPEGVLLRQEALGRFLLFSRSIRVVLDVREEPPTRLSFEDTLLEDFESYAGSWTIQPSSAAVLVEYRLDARPRLGPARAIARSLFHRNVRTLLTKVREEIRRREQAPSGLRLASGSAAP